jgi:hypothetical protein
MCRRPRARLGEEGPLAGGDVDEAVAADGAHGGLAGTGGFVEQAMPHDGVTIGIERERHDARRRPAAQAR